ncbi:MAG: polysaccharide biosynthesis C-terminal domain-containing protein [Bacteroidetes bacterium]|nr:polysaccharide biosynthesis C-terminal domain-containing protein [Bacteroidota bacterium]
MSKLKQLAGETVLYGLGNMVPRLLNFLLFPIHTIFFNPEEYGPYTLLMACVAVLNIVYSFGMETAYFRFATKPGADEAKIFNLAQTAVTAISLFLSLLFISFAASFANLLGVAGHENYIVWLTLIMFTDNVVSIPFARLRLQKKPLHYAAFKITNVVIQIGLTLYFLYFAFNPAIGIGYIFLANLVANLFYLLFFFKTLTSWRPAFDLEVFPSLVRYAYPIMLTGLAGMMNEFFSRLTLERWLPENFYPGRSSAFALGVFGACYKFSVFMNLTVQAFRLAGEPFFFSNAVDKNSPALFARVNHYFIIVCCVILLGVSINMDMLKFLMRKPEYWEGLNIVPPLLLGYLFLGVYYNFSVWFKLTDKTYFGTILTAGGVVLTIGMNFILIPWAGYYGSSWATAIVYGLMAVGCYFFGQRFFPIPYKIVRGILYISFTYILILLIDKVTFSKQLLATGFHALVMGVYLFSIYLIERKTKWHEPAARQKD